MRHDDRTNARDATLDREPRLTVERVRATVFGRRRWRRREGGARAQEEGKRSRQGQLDVRLRVAIKYQTIHSPPSSRASPRRRREKMPHPSPIAALSRALPRFRRSRAAPTKERARTTVSRASLAPKTPSRRRNRRETTRNRSTIRTHQCPSRAKPRARRRARRRRRERGRSSSTPTRACGRPRTIGGRRSDIGARAARRRATAPEGRAAAAASTRRPETSSRGTSAGSSVETCA